jgi:putative membrane protein
VRGGNTIRPFDVDRFNDVNRAGQSWVRFPIITVAERNRATKMAGEFPEDRHDISPDAWREWMLFHTHQRNKLSNERTFLAWVRTSLALITLGFVVQRFDLLVAGTVNSDVLSARAPLFDWVPVLFFVLGGLIVLLGAWSFFRRRHDIARGRSSLNSRLRDFLVVATLAFLLVVSALFVVWRP